MAKFRQKYLIDAIRGKFFTNEYPQILNLGSIKKMRITLVIKLRF
jgi:hypothetical protein